MLGRRESEEVVVIGGRAHNGWSGEGSNIADVRRKEQGAAMGLLQYLRPQSILDALYQFTAFRASGKDRGRYSATTPEPTTLFHLHGACPKV